jgi:hypothetical protein
VFHTASYSPHPARSVAGGREWNTRLTTRLHLVPSLRISGHLTPLPLRIYGEYAGITFLYFWGQSLRDLAVLERSWTNLRPYEGAV